MEPDDLLCSRNARSRTPLVGRAQWKISQPPSLEREQASLEGAYISLDARSKGQPRPLPSQLVYWYDEEIELDMFCRRRARLCVEPIPIADFCRRRRD
jgi:hypothetical protein